MRLYTFFDQLENNREYSRRKVRLDSSPTIENIEINSDCNLSCTICITPPKRERKIMTLDQVMEITGENRELLEGQHIWLHHFGEPLKHPELEGIIHYLVQNGINPRLSTNATLLDEKKSEEIIKAGLSEIVFSIDGMDTASYNSIRKGADFKKVLGNILSFLDIKKSMGSTTPITQVQLVDVYGNGKTADDFISYWSGTSVNWINVKKPSTRAMKVRDLKMRDAIITNYNLKTESNTEYPCYWLWSSLIILSDGNVIPCCTDLKRENILGNVFGQTLMEIWYGDKAMKLRHDQSLGDYSSSPLCSVCPEIRGYSHSFEEEMKYQQARKDANQRPGKSPGINLNHHRLIRNTG